MRPGTESNSGKGQQYLLNSQVFRDRAATVADVTGAAFVDQFGAFTARGPRYLGDLLGDTIHPNEYGHRLIAATLAAALAGELKLPLLAVRFDGLITKYMGETAAKLRQVFDAMTMTRGVYLFDEFDAIGGDRARPNDVGEIRRVLNSFLQFLEADESDSLILAATNHQEILDPALFRRFDDVIRYGCPDPEQVESVVRNRLNSFDLRCVQWDEVRLASAGLSFSEVARASAEAAKEAVLDDRGEIATELIVAMLRERATITTDENRNASGP